MFNIIRDIIDYYNIDNKKRKIPRCYAKISKIGENQFRIKTRKKILSQKLLDGTIFGEVTKYGKLLSSEEQKSHVTWYCECYKNPGYNDVYGDCIGTRHRNIYYPHYDSHPKWFDKFKELHDWNGNYYFADLNCTNYIIKFDFTALKNAIELLVKKIFALNNLDPNTHIEIINYVLSIVFKERINDWNWKISIY